MPSQAGGSWAAVSSSNVTLVDATTPGAGKVTVWELELRTAADIRPAGRTPDPLPTLVRAEEPAPELSRFFYAEVGGAWSWVDRAGWSLAQWTDWVDRPEHELWTCWVAGAPAGYVELEAQAGGAVEVAYFGLLARHQGRGIGGWLLERALRRAFERPGTTRVWLHTCSLDGPNALANYEARGLRVVREYTEWRLVGG